MPAEWKSLTLRDAGVSLIDCEHRTPPAETVGLPYVAIPQLKAGRLDLSDARQISPEHFQEWTRKACPQTHDVILSRRCNPGETAFVPPNLQCALGQNLVLLRADGTKVYPPLLRWLVRGDEWWERVREFLNVGAVFDSLKCADIPNFRLSIPPLEDQKAIASMLSCLDDKIELNWRVNETLESIARVVFKSWFVDCDPIKTKSRSWKVSLLGDICEFAYGKSLKEEAREEGRIPVYGSNGQVGWHSEFLVKGPGIVIGRKGNPGTVIWVQTNFFPIDTTFYVIPKIQNALPYLFHVLSALDLPSLGADSAVPGLNRHMAYMSEVVLPDHSTLAAFEHFVQPLNAMAMANAEQSHTLTILRDMLLPKLLSGEVRIKETEKIIEAYA